MRLSDSVREYTGNCLLGGLLIGLTAPETQPHMLDHLERNGVEVNEEIRELADRIAAIQKDPKIEDVDKVVMRVMGAGPYGAAGAAIGVAVGVLLAPKRKKEPRNI